MNARAIEPVAVGMLGVLVLACLAVAAQEPGMTLPAGTRLRMQFDSAVGTAISRENDGVEVHLLKPVEVEGRTVLPVGTTLSGRVLAIRKGDKHTKTFPMMRLGFTRVTLPDGRTFPVEASLADLGMMLKVDREGAAMPEKASTGERVAGVATAGGVGAGIGGIAGGGKGAATGAGIGAGIGVLMDLATRGIEFEDFTLKKGRKAWLRLDADLPVPPPGPTPALKSDTPGRE